MHFSWLGMRDSNPRSWDQNPVPYHLANPQRGARKDTFELLMVGIRPASGGLATSSLKTSFQEKLALRTATGCSRPDPGARTVVDLPLGDAPLILLRVGIIAENLRYFQDSGAI